MCLGLAGVGWEGGGGEEHRERERENLKQSPHPAWGLMCCLISRPQDHDVS